MAGTCLIIRKAGSDPEKFERLREAGEAPVRRLMQDHFKEIRFCSPDENSWLIRFVKDDEEKFISDRRGWMAFEGTVFALRETRKHTIESLWTLYWNSNNIREFANALDGHFVIKLYDTTEKRYYIVNDFIKNKTQYYHETDAFFCYTSYSFLSAMITEPKADLHAVNEYLWRYYILSERAFLKDTKRLEAASVHKIHHSVLTTEKYWDTPEQYSTGRFHEQTDNMVCDLQETAQLLGRHYNPSVDFTQGQDSRQMVAAMLNQNQSFSTFIFGKSDFYEVQATKDMAQRYRIPHHALELKENFTLNPLKYFKRSMIYGSAEEPGQQLGRITYMREQQMKFGNALCNGTEGRFYKNGLWDEMYTLNFYREPKKVNIDLLLSLRIMSKNYYDPIFIPEYRAIKHHSRDYFYDMIRTRIAGMEHAPVSMQVDRFDINHWLNFGIVSNNAANSFTDSFSPLLFRRNLEDALKVPVKWKFNLSRFQRAVVYKLHPELAAEKTDFAGVNMRPKNAATYPLFLARYGWHQSKRLRDKYLSKLGFHPRTHLQEAWDYLPVYRTLFRQMKDRGYLELNSTSMQEIILRDPWHKLTGIPDTSGSENLADYEYIFKIVTLDRYFYLASQIYRDLHPLTSN